MYGKIFRQMFKGTLAKTGPWQAVVTFQQFIVLADREGVVDMTADSIARETTIPLEIIEIGIAALEQPDPDSRSPDEEGRRIIRLSETRKWGWKVVNYEHYRRLKSEEDRTEYHRQYWREKRSPKAKASTDSTATQQPQLNSNHAVSSKQMHKAEAEELGGRAKRSTATRLPDDFALTEVRREYAQGQKIDPEREFENFRDYWSAAAGQKARKHDWDAAWRGWCRKAADYQPRGAAAKPVLTWTPDPSEDEHADR
jgi:hypothetical protein